MNQTCPTNPVDTHSSKTSFRSALFCIVRDPTAKTLVRNDIQADTFSRNRNQLPRDSAVPT